MDDVQRVKEASDIVNVVSNHVELKKAGTNYKGLCPFHQEKSPSFMVNPSLQIYKCFGCGRGGDVLSFIQEIDRLNFPEALKKAADIAGVELQNNFKKDSKKEKQKAKIYKANDLAAKYYHHIFNTHKIAKDAREYARKRGLNAEMLEKFKFGYAPNNYENLKNFLINKGFTEQELLDCGLIVERKGKTIDKFRERLMQPIYDVSGRVVGFSGRYLGDFEGAPKYLNSAESLVFKKNEILYSLYHSKESIIKKDFVILVEGNLDVVSSHRISTENIVAPLGTAFTQNQAKVIKRFTEKIYFCFDNDNAGLNATIRSIEILEDLGIEHFIIDLGKYKDSDEMIMADPKEWEKAIENAVPTLDYLMNRLSKNLDLGSVQGKAEFNRRIIPILNSLKDPIKINHYVNEVSLILGIPQTEVKAELSSNKSKKFRNFEDDLKNEEKIKTENQDRTNKLEKYLLSLIIQNEGFVTLDIKKEAFQTANARSLFEILLEVRNEINDSVLSTLDDEIQNLYKDLALVDLSALQNPEQEFKKVYNRIYSNYLKQRLNQVRSSISANPDDLELMAEMNQIIRELGEIG